jgi:hypothetical protein
MSFVRGNQRQNGATAMAAPKDARQHAAETEEVLVVVFDDARARFFAREPNGRLTPKNEIKSGLHHFVRDAVSDKPGRSSRPPAKADAARSSPSMTNTRWKNTITSTPS